MNLNRRQFLALSAGSASALFISQCNAFSRSPTAVSPSLPSVISSQNGVLELELAAEIKAVKLGDRDARLMSYGGQVPGPRLEAKPGDRVRIRFTNRLGKQTNLHFHGLHITPTGKGDNPFRRVDTGETVDYEFDIPENSPGVMGWYHPHWHGIVAEQLSGGLAGAFVVRGELDEIPEVKAAREEILILQDFNLDARGAIAPPRAGTLVLGREGNVQAVNGRIAPNLAIAAGEVVRLRVLNASTSRFYRLKLEEHPLFLIATDGGAISKPVELNELLLVPGERADLLVRGDRGSGQFRLLDLPYTRGGMGMMGGPMMGRGMMGRGMMGGPMMGPGDRSDVDTPQLLATMTYEGSVEPQALPDRLIEVPALSSPATTRQFFLNHGMAPGMGMVFLVNGQPFNADRVDIQSTLNTIEEWEIVNTGIMDHPFHLHVHPFQVMSRNGQPEPYPAWKDTVLVPTGESVRIRVKFSDFPGKTVYHCHILDHEDLGMMGTINVRT